MFRGRRKNKNSPKPVPCCNALESRVPTRDIFRGGGRKNLHSRCPGKKKKNIQRQCPAAMAIRSRVPARKCF